VRTVVLTGTPLRHARTIRALMITRCFRLNSRGRQGRIGSVAVACGIRSRVNFRNHAGGETETVRRAPVSSIDSTGPGFRRPIFAQKGNHLGGFDPKV
jgi:hypothetical protein